MTESAYLIDLHHECEQLEADAVTERVSQLAARLPAVSLWAVGGFPFIRQNEGFVWCGAPVTIETLKHHVTLALGASAVLTYTNKNHKTLKGLGHICADRRHLWAYHWINATIVFARQTLAVEMAFARDTRFKMSWPVEGQPTGQVWAATTGLKQWRDFISHRVDKDFDQATRAAMSDVGLLLRRLLP
jgi:hypothetical protein